MEMNGPISVTAIASATVANQPSFDLGGFATKVVETIAGEGQDWETLRDEVLITVGEPIEGKSWNAEEMLEIRNVVLEEGAPELPVSASEHTVGRALNAACLFLESNGVTWNRPLFVTVEKGISVKGTGLGSSGASPAAALKAFEEIMKRLGVDYVFGNHTKAQILMNADQGVPDNSIPAYFGDLVSISQSGGEVELKMIKPHEDFGYFVVVTPKGFGIKTSDARKALEGHSCGADHEECARGMEEAIASGDTKKYGELMERAHAWFVGPRSRLYPEGGQVFDKVYGAAKEAGACGVTISGAGPTVLGLAEDVEKARIVGAAMHFAFKEAGFDSVARLVEVDEEGARVVR